MRKFIVPLMASLLSCSAAFGFWPEATDSSLEIGVGYRQDSIKWKVDSRFGDSYSYDDYYESDGNPVRLRSDLKWSDLQIWQIDIKGKYVTCDNVYLKAYADYGWITSGKNRDSDHIGIGSGSEFEFAKSHSHTKGHVYDIKLAVGYQFKMCDDSFSIAPLVGYSWHGQHLKDRHLRQSFCGDNNAYDSSESLVFDTDSALSATRSYSYSDYYYDSYSYSDYSYSSYDSNHSTYHTRWNGPFIGFDFDYDFPCSDWQIFGGYEFHWAQYHAKAHWNLRPDLFDGFYQRAKNAYGNVLELGVKWDFCECWTAALKGQCQWWWADHGRDRAKIGETECGNVRQNCYLSIPLKDIRWTSGSITLDVGMIF